MAREYPGGPERHLQINSAAPAARPLSRRLGLGSRAWCCSSRRTVSDPDRAASFAMCFVRVQRLFVLVGRVRAHSNTTVLVAAQSQSAEAVLLMRRH